MSFINLPIDWLPRSIILVLIESRSDVLKVPCLSLSILPLLAWWFSSPGLPLMITRWLMQLEAPPPHTTLSKSRKESNFVYLIKNEQYFSKNPPAKFPFSQISLARVMSYTYAWLVTGREVRWLYFRYTGASDGKLKSGSSTFGLTYIEENSGLMSQN